MPSTNVTELGAEATLRKQNEMLAILYTLPRITRFDLDGAIWNQAMSINANTPSGGQLVINPTGTRFYFYNGTFVNQYSCPIPWNVLSLTYIGAYDTTVETGNLTGIAITPDGLRLYALDPNADIMFQYNFGTAWDVSTLAYSGNSVAVGASSIAGIHVTADGTRIYCARSLAKTVTMWTLAVPYDLSTAALTDTLDVSDVIAAPHGVHLATDGAYMYVGCDTAEIVVQYTLTTPYDLGTATVKQGVSIAAEETVLKGIWVSPSGHKLIISGAQVKEVNEYDIT